jgi:hypothetical protein
MTQLIRDFREALGGALDTWELWRPRSLEFDGRSALVEAQAMDGPNARLRTRSLSVSHLVETDVLYVGWPGYASALRLIPMIRAEQTEADADVAVYFYDRIDGSNCRWLSYDSVTRPEMRSEAPQWLEDMLADLDLPSETMEAGPSADHPPAAASTTEVANTGHPLADRLVGAVRGWLLSVDIRITESKVDFFGNGRVGWLEIRPTGLRLLAHVPIETAAVIPGSVISEIPVTEDDQPGVEVAIDGGADLTPAVAFLAQAAKAGGTSHQPFADIANSLAPILGASWRPCFGEGLLPRTDLSRAQQAQVWDQLMQAIAGNDALRPVSTSRWPGSLRLSWIDGVVLSVRISQSATTIAVELSDAVSNRICDGVVEQSRSGLNASGPAVQRRPGRDLLLHVVGPQAGARADDLSIVAERLGEIALSLRARVT